jgi:hypothetical protein
LTGSSPAVAVTSAQEIVDFVLGAVGIGDLGAGQQGPMGGVCVVTARR